VPLGDVHPPADENARTHEQGKNLHLGEGVLERASFLLRRRRVRQLHDRRGRGSHPGGVRQKLRSFGEDQETLRSGELIPCKSEHQTELEEEPEIKP
jgi:hypothetical protein